MGRCRSGLEATSPLGHVLVGFPPVLSHPDERVGEGRHPTSSHAF